MLVAGVLALVLLPVMAPAPVAAAPSPFTLTMESGTGVVNLPRIDEPLLITDPTTVSGTLDGGFDGTGALSDVAFSTPAIEFFADPANVVASFSQPTLSSGLVVTEDDGRASVAVDLTLTLRLDVYLGGTPGVSPPFAVCFSPPIDLALRSSATAPYDPETGLVTVTDPNFSIPTLPVTGDCPSIIVGVANPQLAGAGNAISMTFRGDLDLPPAPGEPSVTTLAAAAGSTSLGAPATFTATVAPGEGFEGEEVPTGAVEFFVDGDQSLGQVALDASQQATLATSVLPSGVHQVTARYLGDPVFSGSTSAPLPHTVVAVPNLTVPLPPEIVAGAPAEDSELTAVIVNPGAALDNVRVDVQLGTLSGLANGHLVLEHLDTSVTPAAWTPITLTGTTNQTGSYGPPTGFSLAAGETREVTFRLSAIAAARQGELPVTIRLNRVHPETGVVVSTLSTQGPSPVRIVPAVRRTTTFGAVAPRSSWANPYQIRQGYLLPIDIPITKGGTSPFPAFTGCMQLYVDGVLTPMNSSFELGEVDPQECRVPNNGAASSATVTSLLSVGQSTTRTWSPGVHTAQVVYHGDAFFQPAVSAEFPITVLPLSTDRPYFCINAAPGLLPTTNFYTARVEVQADLPAVVVPGSTVALGRPSLQITAERNTGTGANTYIGTMNNATAVRSVDLAGQTGVGTFTSAVLAAPAGAGAIEHTTVFGGIEVALPVTGAPGDVIDVTLDSWNATLASGTRAACTPVGEPISLGQVTVAGTTVRVDHPSAVVGDAVTLTANVFPASAQGFVEFFDGETSLGITALDAGTATLRTRDLPAGERSVTARHLGDLVAPATASEPVVVAVRAIDCADFAQSGSGAVVRLVYLELLGRCPDAAGFAYWTGRLDAGTSAEVLARAIARTPEAVGVVVDDAYRTMLDRSADGAGRDFWVGRLIAGSGRYDQLLADLGASGEFWSLSGGTTTGFVTRVYEQLLGRAPDQAGSDYWVGRLDGGASPRALVLSLANLDEPLGVQVAGSYDQLLARAPEAAERASGITFLRATGDRPGLSAQLIGTAEFTQRAQSFPNPGT